MTAPTELERYKTALVKILDEYNEAELGEPIYALEAYAIDIVERMRGHALCAFEEGNSKRCPYCKHVSTVSTQDGDLVYFYCQNPKCSVERIYSDDSVMISGGVLKRDERL